MQKRPQSKSLRSLDALNFFLADVRDGVGPYLAVYLQSSQQWNPAQIGIAMSASGIASVIAQTPAGALIDRVRQKRLTIVVASALVAIGCTYMALFPTFASVLSSQALIGISAAFFPPAVAAIALGLVGHSKLDQRIGRNEAFNHAGNVTAAALAGLVGKFIALEGIFFLVAIMAMGSAVSVLRIREEDIDHEVARGAVEAEEKEEPEEHRSHVSGIVQLLSDRRLALFAICAVLFHFANAAMLPLVGQELSAGKANNAALYMSACIIVAQLVMVPISSWAGRWASRGRKPLFLVAFAVLPIRGVLYTLSENPYFLVSVQILDGVGAGIFGVLSVLVVADLTKGTGRFNVTQGAISTAVGIGASLSNLMTGFVVQKAGYSAGFLTLSAIAAVALATFWFAMPETK